MKRKKAILEALVLSSIMILTIPEMAGAETTTSIGPVTVDGAAATVAKEGAATTVGKAGSSVSIGKMKTDPCSFYLVGNQKVDVLGKKVTVLP